MTATDELRKLLDERGVEWTYADGTVSFANNGHWCHAWAYSDNAMCVSMGYFTPDQAIAATLGSGTCIVTRDLNCSNCGKRIGFVRNCEMYETCDGRQAWKSLDHEVCDVPNYCPNCGRKVVEQ